MAAPDVAANRETMATATPQTEPFSARPERRDFILVSLERSPRFYVRVGKRILMGRDGKAPFDEFSVSGLGMATKVAIGTAALLQEEGCVTIDRIETAYFASVRRKWVPKITIVCKKTKEFDSIMEKEREARTAAAPLKADPEAQQHPETFNS